MREPGPAVEDLRRLRFITCKMDDIRYIRTTSKSLGDAILSLDQKGDLVAFGQIQIGCQFGNYLSIPNIAMNLQMVTSEVDTAYPRPQ